MQVILLNQMPSGILNDILSLYNHGKLKENCEFLGTGENAHVYGYGNFAIKVFKKRAIDKSDPEFLEMLQGHACFPTLYAYIKNEIMITRKINGRRLDFVNPRALHPEWMDFVEDALLYAKSIGLKPLDINEGNIIFNEFGFPMIIDVGAFMLGKATNLDIQDELINLRLLSKKYQIA